MELVKGMTLKSKNHPGVTITLLEEKGNGWRFYSESNKVKALWSNRYINAEFEPITEDKE